MPRQLPPDPAFACHPQDASLECQAIPDSGSAIETPPQPRRPDDRTEFRDCTACPRLVTHRNAVKECYPDYHCRPVDSWGSPRAHLLVVGLAPGLHGANRTGRPFTGDASGDFLFAALHRAGFATAPTADRARLRDVRITNAVRCLPPENRPTTTELRTCSAYLAMELAELWRPHLRRPRCLIALGRLAHSAVALAGGWALPDFRHGQAVPLAPALLLIDSYHPSRQNTNTGRLTAAMLDAALVQARRHLDGRPA